MSWLDANEVFLMEVVCRDRVDDLRSAIDVSTETDDGTGETPGEVSEDPPWWCRRVSVARA